MQLRLKWIPISGCHAFFAGALSIVVAPAYGIGLDEIAPAKKISPVETSDQVSDTPTKLPGGGATKDSMPAQPENPNELVNPTVTPEPGRTERWLQDNLTLGLGANLVWPSGNKDWSMSGSGRTGNADLIVAMSIPNSALNLRKQKNLNLKGTFRYSPVTVVGSYDSLPYRGVWAGYHSGLEGHLKLTQFYDMTAVAGVEAGFVLVYLQPLDEFNKAKSAESTGVLVTIHGGGDWLIGNGIKCGPRVYVGFGSMQNYQLGATTTFAF